MIKEKVLEIFYQLGFQPEFIDDNFGYRFEYEGLTIPQDNKLRRQ